MQQTNSRFRSYAKGIATPTSDIDLYLMSNGAITGFDFSDLKAKTDKSIDLQSFSVSMLPYRSTPFNLTSLNPTIMTLNKYN
jgi:predicted nucleotidyltransferase